MEDMMMVMMKIRSNEHHNPIPSKNNLINIPIISPTWKLYENPFYINSHQIKPQINQEPNLPTTDQIHKLNLPISARKIAASFWDLTFIKPVMESELESARLEITQLKSELEIECRARKKTESLNKRLERELSEQRKNREALEKVCEELAKEISSHKSELIRIKKEIEEERKMLRTAEVIREERVQMKLADARFLLEEKLGEFEIGKKLETGLSSSSLASAFKKEAEVINNQEIGDVRTVTTMQRKGAASNPHIRRGIKGFVEFPKVVRAIGCRSSKQLGKLECQKAQLKILLKQKGDVRLDGLIAG